jgi:hypothetical protein
MSDSKTIRKRTKVQIDETDAADYLENKLLTTSDIVSTVNVDGETELELKDISTVTAGTYTLAAIKVEAKGRVYEATSNTGLTPSGAAGGSLAGNYPTPTLSLTGCAGAYTYTTIDVTAEGRLIGASSNTGLEPSGAAGAAGSDLSGSYPTPAVAKITETSGPTSLTIGTITDGQYLKRSGATVVSAVAGLERVATDGSDLAVFKFDEVVSATTPYVYVNTGVEAGNMTWVDGTNTFPGTVGAPFGTAMIITGSSTHHKTADGLFQPANYITVSCWIRVSRFVSDGTDGKIISKLSDPWPTMASPYLACRLTFLSTERLQFTVRSGGTNRIANAPNKGAIQLYEWCHVGGTHDGAAVNLYINGKLAATTAAVGVLQWVNNGPWFIGPYPGSTGECCYMAMHDLRIANVARPLSWFQEVYQKGTGKNY